jgi:hypothetical protein
LVCILRRRSSRGVTGSSADNSECGAAVSNMASEESAIGAATIKARQFFKRNLAEDL